ncbi:hypothetical protein Nmel_018269, partial [Mimus melanotis]
PLQTASSTRFCHRDLSSLLSVLCSLSGGGRTSRGWDLPLCQREGEGDPPQRVPGRTASAAGLSCSRGPCWAGRWSRTEGERGTDFLLTCLGLLGHLPLPLSLLLLHWVRAREGEILLWGKTRDE